MAAIDDRRTVTKTAARPFTGADVLVESLVRHDVDVVFAYPGRGEHAPAPGADALLATGSGRSCPATNKGGSSPPRAMPGPPANRAW